MKTQITKAYYETTEEFKHALQTSDWFDSEEIEYLFGHETQHFNAARKLGYQPRYCIERRASRKGKSSIIVRDVFIEILEGQRASNRDRIKIALAPRDPSKQDYALAGEAGGEI